MTRKNTRPTTPKPKGRAHTELRRHPGPQAEGQTPLKPRTPPERLPTAEEDGLEDLFNDMPV